MALTKERIERYLREVGAELERRGLVGELLIVGGAFMALVLHARRTTKDVDAIVGSDPKPMREAAVIVAKRHALPADWLNDAAKGFIYTQPPQHLWAEYPGLRLYVPGADYVFAMKADAARPEDQEDLIRLRDELGLNSMTTDALLQRGKDATGYRLSTVSRSFDRIRGGEDPWIAFGDFLDDWRRAEPDQRMRMVREPIATTAGDPNRRWAALFTATIDWLCWTAEPRMDGPAWLADPIYVLPTPWFVAEGTTLHDWQLVESPAPFRMRGIYTDANVVARA